MIRFVDWFAGIGGFRYGLEKANIKSQTTQEGQGSGNAKGYMSDSGGEYVERAAFSCVGACEIDKWCRAVYARNFGHKPEWGDSRAVDPAELPDFDLFCAGFPCQSFSVAGKRRGFRDPRGTLFFEILRICEQKRPGYLLLENVKGLLSVDNGFTFEAILNSLSEIGYDLQWEVLNSKHFEVPQNRERVFIIGHLRGIPRPQVFPLGTPDEANGKVDEGNQSVSPSLQERQWRGQGKQLDMLMIDEGGCQPDGANIGSVLGSEHEPMPKIRQLTPLECERLQGFPDGWTEGVSDTQRYKALGNAVTTNVVEAIRRRLLDEIREAKQ